MSKDSKQSSPEIELVPDAWPRFERFIKQIAKVGPAHRDDRKTKKKAGTAAKPRIFQLEFEHIGEGSRRAADWLQDRLGTPLRKRRLSGF